MIEQFNSLVNRLLVTNQWQEIEQQRLKLLRLRAILIPLTCLFMIVIGFSIFITADFLMGFITMLLSIPAGIYVSRSIAKRYSSQYKAVIMPLLITEIVNSYSENNNKVNITVSCNYNQTGHVDNELLLNLPHFNKIKTVQHKQR